MLQNARPNPFLREEPEAADGLRVALFSGNYNYTRDGANKALNRLVAHLLERGAAVRVYSPTSRHPAFQPAGELVSVPSLAIPGRSEFRVALGLPRAIARDVRAFAPNLVHVSAPDWLGTAAQRLAREMGVPIVASMHTRFETYVEYYGLRRLHGWAVNRQRQFYCTSDRVLAPNDPSGQQLIAMGVPADRIGIWSRGVEHAVFNPARRDPAWRRALGYSDDDVVLLFFGRIVREKGTACFAETVRELRQRGLAVRPLVVGEGPARAELAGQLGEAVFLGHLDGDELGRAVASSDILLNPSLTEAFGNVNLEAMAAGLCVVSANAGSASAIITDRKDGYLVDADPRALADAIVRLTNHPATRRRIGRNAVATARLYQWSEVLDEVVRTYRELT
ncbi:MAG TPA: glycosyltransferase family 1 protein [Sphingomicrobium sp.]|nr:glycosyltransferase family 1 protein [Sphingomicrobium sp.]